MIKTMLNGKRGKVPVILLVVFFTLLLASGCSSQKSQQPAKDKQDLKLFVAAGMKKPMDAVIEKFQAEKGVKVTPNYGSSGGLWAQIREGQPCDLFYTADWIYIEKAQGEGKLAEAKKFLNDNLVLVVSKSGEEKVKTIQDLAKPGVSFVIADPQAPVGVYSENALKNLGFWEKVSANLKARPSTVNQVAIMVKEDQVDAGLIFSSVANGNQLKAVQAIDQKSSGEIVFGVGMIKGGNEQLAGEFMEFAFKHVDEFSKYGWKPYE